MSELDAHKYVMPSNDFGYFGYSCLNQTTCVNLMIDLYKEKQGVSDVTGIDFSQRVNCYINDAPNGNNPNKITETTKFTFYESLNKTFCACRVDYGWEGALCDTPSYRSQADATMFFILFGLMLIISLYRLPLVLYSFNSSFLSIKNARGFTFKAAVFSHSFLYPFSALSLGVYCLTGPKSGAIALLIYIIVYLLAITTTILSLLTLTVAFIDIATSMKQLEGLKRARAPLVCFIISYFVLQILFILVKGGNESLYVTVAMFVILLFLVIIGPGWMFYKFSVSLLQEQSSETAVATPEKRRQSRFPFGENFITGCSNCMRALISEMMISIWNHNTEAVDDGGDDDAANQDSKVGVVTEIASSTVLPKPGSKLDLGSQLGSEMDSPKARTRAASKDVVAVRDVALSFDIESKKSKSSLTNSPTTKEIHVTEANESDRASKVKSKRISLSALKFSKGKSKGNQNQGSDKKVAKFLSRVLQFSIRTAIWIIVFVVTIVYALSADEKYFTASSIDSDASIHSFTTFFQCLYAFLITDGIIWFFSDVLRREMVKNKSKSITSLKRTVPDPINKETIMKDVQTKAPT